MSSAHPETWPVAVVRGSLDPDLIGDVTALLAAATETDGNPPLSEQSVITLSGKAGSADLLSLALYAGGDDPAAPATPDLAGFAVVLADPEGGDVLEVAVHPNYRNRGVADRLVEALKDERGLANLQAWSHGNHEAAGELAARYGFGPVRELWKMRLASSATDMPDVGLPEGVSIRAFVPGQDEEAWLKANREAFAHHPEQGAMTRADLDARMAEEWFDPAGFLLAVDAAGTLLGFHWTKIHPGQRGHQPLGEVYVVGVSPAAQGMGLGKALTVAGITYLRHHDLAAIMLYTDADNTAAVSLYTRLGFTRWDVDVMFAPLAQR